MNPFVEIRELERKLREDEKLSPDDLEMARRSAIKTGRIEHQVLYAQVKRQLANQENGGGDDE